MLLRIALRNLRLHWVRTLIVGLLLGAGTTLIVVGQGAIDAIQAGVRKSVVDTLSGHLQLYSSNAKDELELYQSAALAVPDLGQIDDFEAVKKAVLVDPDVEAIVPMGLGRSIVWGESTLESKLTELRRAVNDGTKDRIPALVAHLRKLCGNLVGDLDKLAKVAADTKEADEQKADVLRASSDAFWKEFESNPLDGLEFLDNRIAPLGLQTGFYFFNYVGTDLTSFGKNFGLFRIQSGQMVPEGERGFLFNHFYYERFVKNRTARRLDDIKEARDLAGSRILTDTDLQRQVERNLQQVSQITDQLDPEKAALVVTDLQKELGSQETDLNTLVAALLETDDDNFDKRYEAFYRIVAPRIRLYAYMVGDTISLYGQTKSGYPRAVNVKVWGVFRYEGLEKSGLAGVYNLMDMMSFRDLNGMSDPISPDELAAIKARAGIKAIDRDLAEDALFGGDAELVEAVDNQAFDALAGNDLSGLRKAAQEEANRPFTRAELERGPVVNAAVFLKDPATNLERLPEIKARLEAAFAQAKLPIKVSPWEEARGTLVSSLSTGITVFFFVLVGIIFLVALIVIVNSLLMSTMERVQEIGTIRAMGAQRGFVVRMFAIEAAAMTVIFGAGGMALGAAIVLALGANGVPATSEVLFFVFGGKTLNPVLQPGHLGVAVLAIGLVTLFASLIPAWVASRIPPIAAMQAKE
jgi:ABC-type lipoprotein release transport system permease subunit